MIIDLKDIFEMQVKLDAHIHKTHNISYKETSEKLKLSLAVEVSELANEVRCFKFWSLKKRSEDATVLEEYVDGIHFITAICISFNSDQSIAFNAIKTINDKNELSKLFIDLLSDIKGLNTKEKAIKWYSNYLALGYALGFNINQIKTSYTDKNKINHDRQNTKY